MECGALTVAAEAGMRLSEATGLRWRELDQLGSCLRLEHTKTGKSTRPLGRPALDHLRSLPRLHDEFVFPNRRGDGPADLKKRIAALFDAAGLDHTSHDLRRGFASLADEMDYSEPTIRTMLGQTARGVTQRHYIHKVDKVLVEAASRVSQAIANALDGVEAEVVELRREAQ